MSNDVGVPVFHCKKEIFLEQHEVKSYCPIVLVDLLGLQQSKSNLRHKRLKVPS